MKTLALLGTVTGIALFVCASMEFFADKVPWVDSLWDAVHAFLRPAGR